MAALNRNLLSSNLLGERVTAAGSLVSSSRRDLVRLWEEPLPLRQASTEDDGSKDTAESVEIRSAAPHREDSSLSLGSLLSAAKSLFSLSSALAFAPSQTATSAISAPLRAHHQAYLAVLQEAQLVILRGGAQGFAATQRAEMLVFSAARLRGRPQSVCWTNDDSPSLLVGTDQGLVLLVLPDASVALEHANAELRVLTSVSEAPTVLAAAPQGRLALVSCGADLRLLDVWMDTSSVLLNGSIQVESVTWSSNGEKVWVHYRNGEITVLETFDWKSRSYRLLENDDEESALSFHVHRRVKFLWTHDQQTLLVTALDSARSLFHAEMDVESPGARRLRCAAIDSEGDGLRAAAQKTIHDVTISRNGRFLAISYRDTARGAVDCTIEIFEFNDAESMTFKHLSSVQRHSVGEETIPLSFAFAAFADRGERRASERRGVLETDIYADRVPDEARALSLFPPVELRRESRAFNAADRFLLWVSWSDNVLVPYVVG